MKSCCNPLSARLAVEEANQVSLAVCDCCRKVERMELVAVVAGGSKSQETEVQMMQIVVSAGHMTIDG